MGLLKTVFALVLLSCQAHANVNPDGSVVLSHHVPQAVRLGLAPKLGAVPPGQIMDLRFLLSSRDPAGMENFIKTELYNPKSPNYHKFLTGEQFNLMYGASTANTAILLNYLKSHGFTVKYQSKNGFVIAATAPASAVESVFKVHINTYKRLSDKYTFFSNDTNPTVAPQIAGTFYAIAGLDNARDRFHPHFLRGNSVLQPVTPKSPSKTINLNSKTALTLNIAGARLASPRLNEKSALQSFMGFGQSMGPSDVDAIYDLNSVSSNGTGQTLGVYELDGFTAGDVGQFESYYTLPNMTLTIVPTDLTDCSNDVNSGVSGCDTVTDCLDNNQCTDSPASSETAGPSQDEVVTDIDLAVGIAPGLSSVRVYEAPNTADGWIDQWNTIVNDNSRPNIISVSWGGDEADNYSDYDHTVFSNLAALGVSVFASSGDSGAYDVCDGGTLPPNCTIEGIGGVLTNTVFEEVFAGEPASYGDNIFNWLVANNYLNGQGNVIIDPTSQIVINAVDAEFTDPGEAQIILAVLAASVEAANPPLSVDDPASDQYVTGVGMTIATANQTVDGMGNITSESYGSETASLYSGGGISSFVDLPTYQLAAATSYLNAAGISFGSTSMRNVPDVSLTADQDTPYGIYVSDQSPPGWYPFSGTSIATPIWAAFVARVNQGRVALGETSVGYLNPELYQVEQSSQASSDFYDITTGNNSNYPAETGYDPASGIGSFNGVNLYADLIGLPPPTALTAAEGDTQVSLSWTAPSSGSVASYIVSRATASTGPYTAVSTLNSGSPCASVVSASCVDNGLTDGQSYYYEVSGVNTAGIQGANSTDVHAIPIAAPTGLSATGGSAQVSLSWTAVAGASSYHIKRSTTSGSEVTVASSGTNSYTDTGLNNGTTYYYEVSAVNAAGEGANSSESSATPFGPPSGFTAAGATGQVALSWTNEAGAASYNIYRSTTSGTEILLTNVASPAVSYNDAAVTNGTTYYYEITGVTSGSVESGKSSEISATPLAIPTGLTATPGNAQVGLSWTAVTGATSYHVKRSTTSGSEVTVATVTAPAVTYNDTNLNNGTTYYYEVSAVAAGSESTNSSEANAAPFGAPSGFTAAGATGQVALSWTNEVGAASYKIYRSTTSGAEVFLTSVSSPAVSYNDAAVSNGTTYYYEITAVNGGSVESGKSSEISATPLAIPTGLTATPANAQVVLSWAAVTGASSYHIKRSTTSGSEVTVASSGTNSYTDTTSLNNGTTYYYEVSAVAAGSESTNSSEANATPFGPPSGFTAAVTTGQVSLSWTNNATAVSYNIYRSTTSGAEVLLTNVTSPAVTYNDAAVTNGTTYYYEITAVNSGSVESVKSAEITATPMAAPTGLAAAPGNAQVLLNWTATPGATSYHVKRSTTSGSEVTVATSVPNSYTDTGLMNGTTYYYEVSAVNAQGEGNNSAEASTTAGLPTPPTTVTATGGNQQATVYFSGGSGDGSPIDIYTVTPYIGASAQATVTGSSSPIIVTGLTNFTTYTFTVTAHNTVGTSSPSAASNNVTPTPLAPPSSLKTTILGAKIGSHINYIGAYLTWSQSPDPSVSQNNIYRSTNGGSFFLIATVSATTSYKDTSTTSGVMYTYEVTAAKPGPIESAPTNTASVNY